MMIWISGLFFGVFLSIIETDIPITLKLVPLGFSACCFAIKLIYNFNERTNQ